jgi:hypothetical protein
MSVANDTMDVMCNHEHLVCPEHEGEFDCHSFCPTCEGFQEYCPEGCEVESFEGFND